MMMNRSPSSSPMPTPSRMLSSMMKNMKRLYRNDADTFKGNPVPRRVFTLEKRFDINLKFQLAVNVKTNSSSMIHVLINPGT